VLLAAIKSTNIKLMLSIDLYITKPDSVEVTSVQFKRILFIVIKFIAKDMGTLMLLFTKRYVWLVAGFVFMLLVERVVLIVGEVPVPVND
jgi:hypothetical protein